MVMVRCRELSLSCGGVDLSESGIRIQPQERRAAPQAPLDLLLSLSSKGWIQLRARVARVDEGPSGETWALRFETPSGRVQETLRRVVDELLVSQSSSWYADASGVSELPELLAPVTEQGDGPVATRLPRSTSTRAKVAEAAMPPQRPLMAQGTAQIVDIPLPLPRSPSPPEVPRPLPRPTGHHTAPMDLRPHPTVIERAQRLRPIDSEAKTNEIACPEATAAEPPPLPPPPDAPTGEDQWRGAGMFSLDELRPKRSKR